MNKYLLYPSVFGVFAVTNKKKCFTNVSKIGKIKIFDEKNKLNFDKYNKFLIRGFFYFIFGIYYTFKGLFFANKDELNNISILKKTEKSLNISLTNIIVFIILIISLLLSVVLLGVLPIKLSVWLSPKNFDVFLKRLIVWLCKSIIIFIIFLIIKFMPILKEYYSFNYACLQQQKQNGQINFLNYFLFCVFFVTLIISMLGVVASKWYFFPLNLFVSLVSVSVAFELYYEILKIKWLNILLAPINFLIYQKPSQLAQKCVKIVLSELELSNNARDKMQNNMLSENDMAFSEAYVIAKEKLEKAGRFEKSDLDFIFCEVLNKGRAEVKLIKSISKSDFKKIEKVVERRAVGEPITKIFGHANFYGLDFVVTKDVLSPRSDTERLVEEVLNDIKALKNKPKVLDIGTGSGAIAITLAKLSNAKVTAVDISDKALAVAKDNAEKNNVKVNFVKSDLFSALGRHAKFDIIVSNPPYIPSKDIENLDDEVKKHDPILALDGGADGLNFYREIIDGATVKLARGGRIYLEVGVNQAQQVKKLLQKNFKDIRIVKDYNKIERVVCATLD
ncbi:MAG: peptide chain release factor N(5)-glutamine methyltransferase [Clostridia bacterium]|nr:peptide chain release factor N(5)-glutamine methyltransferase [Clostridia bacterium]